MRATIRRDLEVGSPTGLFEEFKRGQGEPESLETSDKTWNSYYEANQDYNGCAYVFTPVLPEEYPVGEEAELPGNPRSRRRDAADDSGRRGA